MSETERKASFYERYGSFSEISGCVLGALALVVTLVFGSGSWTPFFRPDIRYNIPLQEPRGERYIAVVQITNEGRKGSRATQADIVVSGTELLRWTKGDDVLSGDRLREVERNRIAFNSNGIPAAETRTLLLEMADRGSIDVMGTFEWLDGVHSIAAVEPDSGILKDLPLELMIPWFAGTFIITRKTLEALFVMVKKRVLLARNEKSTET